MKKGVLLVNLGTPDAPTHGAVYRYLKQFLLDKRVIDINPIARNLLVRGIIAPFRSKDSAKLYKKLWTEEGSPLKVFGYKLRDGVQELLGEDYIVALGMRYQSPSLDSAIQILLDANVSEITLLPLFPQYTSACNGSVYEEVSRILSKELNIPKVKFINSFYDHPKMIETFALRAEQYKVKEFDHYLFSYHGLPERQILKSDKHDYCKFGECCGSVTEMNQFCYRAHCFATTRAIQKRLNLPDDKVSISFQSRLGNAPWIQPYTSDVIEELANQEKKQVLVFCPAFIADCLETTIEVSEEYMEEFQEFGGEHLQLVEGLNDHPLWFEAVRDMILEA